MRTLCLSCAVLLFMRGVVMGRREDGAAVRNGAEMCPRPHRVGQAGKPCRRSMRRRGLRGNVPRNSRAMAGLRSQALRPAARSWLTGVPGPRSRKRGPSVAERRQWSAGRRLVPKGARGRLRTASHQAISPIAHRASRTPPRLPALRSSLWEPRIAIRKRAHPGRTSRIRAMARAPRHSGARPKGASPESRTKHRASI